MDHRPLLEALGADTLAHLTLEGLEDKIIHIPSDSLSREHVLHTFMGWLHEQITRDIQQKSLLSDFVNLLLKGGKLQLGPFSKIEVEAAFKEWQRRDAERGPENLRRYQMVEMDLKRLFDPDSNPDYHIEDDIDNEPRGKGRQQTGSNTLPLGQRKAPRENIHQKILRIKEDNIKKGLDKVPVKDEVLVQRSSNLSLGHKSPKVVSPTKSQSKAPSAAQQLAGPVPRGYICKRCGSSGHWVQFCPTNLDERFDKPPAPSYQCRLCRAYGQHFATLCPRNENKVSLTQQRKHYEVLLEARPQTRSQDVALPYRERGSPPLPTRRRSRSPMRSPTRTPFSPVDPPRNRRRDTYGSDDSSRTWSRDYDTRHKRDVDRSSISPWAARERMTRERFGAEKDSHQLGTSSYYRPEPGAPSLRERRLHRDTRSRSPPRFPSRGRFCPIVESKREDKANEGRLAYDNDVFVDFDTSPETPKDLTSSTSEAVSTDRNKNETIRDTAGDANGTAEETERIKKEVDEFLDALAIEMFGSGLAPEASVNKDAATGHPDYNMNVDEEEDGNIGGDDVASVPMETTNQPVQAPHFSPEVVALFKNRPNLIINKKPNRRTALEMMIQKHQPEHILQVLEQERPAQVAKQL
ncbi:uncharacterized protein F4822DRAFT_431429 [Hypoxylon trugodes]|uniref:uncharacterized protein n=1 Tax=Hypoxylon trugodes TaxID=326681 RepID=UPI00219B1505|nr:uncharacterized protein F4822DRAFT_431429 [Hypoxylon trugodes]KAI1386557.1 hypothetical protein F4822DRAFT_431429 [Hypoxylon trugodes]